MNVRLNSFLLVLALAACSGGGGSTTTVVVTTSNSGSAPVQQQSVQRSLASASLLDTQSAGQIAQFGQGGSLGTASALRRTIDTAFARQPSALRTTQTVCNGGVELTLAPSGPTAHIHEQTFYDVACTQLFQDINLDETLVATNSVSLAGSETQYTRAGAVFSYDTLTGALVGAGTATAQLSLEIVDAANSAAPVRAVAGLSCNVTPTAQSCGSGGVEHVAALSQDFGATLAANVVTMPAQGGGLFAAFNGNGTSYKGVLNALALSAGAFPTWSVSGGGVADSVTLSGGLTFNAAGIMTSGQLNFFDAAADASVILTASGQPLVIAGVIRQSSTGQTEATFTVDVNGNGTITFSNGAIAAIVAWQVAG